MLRTEGASAPATVAEPHLIGKVVQGGLKIVRQIGTGGMGTVYEAVEPTLGTRFAIKRLHPEVASNPEIAKRFDREAVILAQLSHPNIVKVIKFDRDEDLGPLVTMEYIEGVSFLDVIEDTPRPSDEDIVTIMRDVISAVEYAHRQGIVHRDLKPENVTVRRLEDDGRLEVKVLDFGIARILDVDKAKGGRVELTQANVIMGTPYYMAPEQCFGGKPGVQWDVYALGVMLYYALTGHLPHAEAEAEVESMQQLVMKCATAPIAEIRTLRPDLPEKLCTVIMRAIDKDAKARWSSVKVFREAFTEAVMDLLRQRGSMASHPSLRPSREIIPGAPKMPRSLGPDAPHVTFDFEGVEQPGGPQSGTLPSPADRSASRRAIADRVRSGLPIQEAEKPRSYARLILLALVALVIGVSVAFYVVKKNVVPGLTAFIKPAPSASAHGAQASAPASAAPTPSVAAVPAPSTTASAAATEFVTKPLLAQPAPSMSVAAPTPPPASTHVVRELRAELKTALDRCTDRPVRGNADCRRFCLDDTEWHFFHETACQLAGLNR